MTERNKDKVGMNYEVMDICEMTYPDNYFDIAIDKSTMDSLLCGENPVLHVAKMTKEVFRVLKPNGLFISLSFGKPENRE